MRWAISLFYFAMGLTSATWASRIPDLKSTLQLSESELGNIFFAIPLGQLLIMPFSGKIVTRFGSHIILTIFISLYIIGMTNIGLATERWHLWLALFLFGICGNLSNIAVNTQGIYIEKLYGRTIMSSFHGAWSIAGFSGALIGIVMMSLSLTPYTHFWIAATIGLILVVVNAKFLIRAKEKKKDKTPKKFFSKPDATLLWLGFIGFCCMMSEGVMFDWSGVYFKDIVKAPGSLVILGYTSFMIMMAAGRFLGDRFIQNYGRKTVMVFSGCLISAGLYLSVIFPNLIVATLSFMMVGIGVSTIVPTVYSLAGKTTSVPPGEALTIVSSVSFLGFLLGPPVIGYIAEAAGLRVSFSLIGMFGFIIAFLAYRIRLFSN
jgi:MFS family permease